MKFLTEFLKAGVLLLAMGCVAMGSASGQETRTLGKESVVVRLCPTKCVAVNGHKFKPGGEVKVFETKSGWVRISEYLNRSKLVPSFGKSITRKPALWIATAQLAGATDSSNEGAADAAKKPETEPIAGSLAGLKRIAAPTFRPNSKIVRKVEVPTAVSASTTPATESGKAESTASDTPQVPTSTIQDTKSASRVETWDEVQEKLKNRTAEQKNAAGVSEADTSAVTKMAVEDEQESKPAEVVLGAQRAADQKIAGAENASAATKQKTELASAAKLADENKVVDAQKAATEAEKQAGLAKASKLAEEKKAAELAKKMEAAEAEKAEAATAAKEKAELAIAEADATKKQKMESQQANTATPVDPQAEDKADDVTMAAVETVEPESEPVYKSAVADPIAFGARPEKMTKELLDKRLSKLPGSKSKVRKDIVIALRHYALGLLNSGECSGIFGGGASAVPGMLYVACSDDPKYLRQFPVKEESW
jgi:hypothetical protein